MSKTYSNTLLNTVECPECEGKGSFFIFNAYEGYDKGERVRCPSCDGCGYIFVNSSKDN